MDIYLMAAEFLFLVITFQFVTAPRLSLGEYWDAVNHNEEFLKNNPGFISENPPRSSLLGYILGIIFIFIIGIGVEKKSMLLLQFVHYASVVVFAGQFLHNYFYLKKIKQKIPNSSKRSTRLEQRNIYQFISKKILVIFGIFFSIAFIGILAAFLAHKVSLQLFMTRFLPPIFVIVFLFSLVFFEARTGAVKFSKWTRYETILRASFTVVVFVATGFLIDLYIRLTGVLFEMPHFTNDSFYEYLLGGAALTAFMHFVLNMKLDIPDWYEKKSFQK